MNTRQTGDSGANNQSQLLRDFDQTCDRFEAAWCAGQNPLIEEYIEGKNEPLRLRLLRELVALEVAYRQQSGETPACAEYETRFTSDKARGTKRSFRNFPWRTVRMP